MNFKKILYTALFSAGCLSASAQKMETVETFNPHWYVQAQVGGEYDLGEIKFSKLLSPNVQLAGGYQFTPVWGLRLAVNGWQSKAGSKLSTGKYYWKWNHITPNVDATMSLVNLIGGYKPRLVDAGILAGIGCNVAWGNDEAQEVNAAIAGDHGWPVGSDVAFLHNLWDGSKARFTGRFGAFVDFHTCKRVDVGLEVTAATLSDKYNSKKADNTDWMINAMVGVKVHLGKLTRNVQKKAPCEDRVVERVVEKPVDRVVEKVVEKVVYREKDPEIRRDIFFAIRSSKVTTKEMVKVDEIVSFLKDHPNSKVEITSYADKGTGNNTINQKYSEQRSASIKALLVKKGVAESRITVSSKGDSEQPFSENDRNRVSVCIAK